MWVRFRYWRVSFVKSESAPVPHKVLALLRGVARLVEELTRTDPYLSHAKDPPAGRTTRSTSAPPTPATGVGLVLDLRSRRDSAYTPL